MSRRHIGAALLISALVLVGAALVMWGAASDAAEKDQLAEEYRAAINGGPVEDIDPNRAGPIAIGATAAVLFLSGVVVLATSPSDGS